MDGSDPPDLLTVIIDVRLALLEEIPLASSKGKPQAAPSPATTALHSTLLVVWEGLLVLFRAHFELGTDQRIAVLAAGHRRVELLASGGPQAVDMRAATTKLAAHASEQPEAPQSGNGDAGPRRPPLPLLGPALAKALCHMNRIRDGEGYASMAAHVLIVSASADAADLSGQAMALTSSAYAAKKLGVPVDLLSLGQAPSALLRQVSILTGGRHQTVPHGGRPHPLAETLPQMLLFHFLPGVAVRKDLCLVDDFQNLPAVCVCHGYAREIAYVCSCCLALYCSAAPAICTVCRTRFRHGVETDPRARDLDVGALASCAAAGLTG